jgi:glycosyltransferase involved in cell wall biosynthesis
VAYIPGVGIDTARYGQFRAPDEVDEGRKRAGKIRKELQIPEDALVLLTVGDLIVRKNQKTVIEALSKTGRNDLYYVLCGQGPLKEEYEKMAERLGVGGQIRFAGYRKDVGDFYTMADLFVFPSYQEGLSVAVMEAMANGLPMVLSRIRGNVDLVRDGEGGFLCGPDDAEAFAGRIELLAEQPELRRKMGEKNLREIKKYDLSEADRRMRRIYRKMLGGAV